MRFLQHVRSTMLRYPAGYRSVGVPARDADVILLAAACRAAAPAGTPGSLGSRLRTRPWWGRAGLWPCPLWLLTLRMPPVVPGPPSCLAMLLCASVLLVVGRQGRLQERAGRLAGPSCRPPGCPGASGSAPVLGWV